ncbi:type 1 glutamine amidotransferase [Methylovorus menthalis]|uniref:type 1 glutamine amidotransferase n=1 Tax=Methylovorus menthalis TaxID=1002227 RepID=UPI001E41F83E|nr:type 1 glutamine amidotransferase [Methylovorus menthalis]MCB4810488.1 type 1 glutamine amidotransferase [Methylovorus menthalis]
MKPVIIFRHAAVEGPGFLAQFLDAHQIPWRLLKIDQGESAPTSIADYSGMVLMGGPMSVHDDLPWIAPVLGLIREAHALDIPLLGHCLGGQLISQALGGQVTLNPIKEIGWGMVSATSVPEAKAWFGDQADFLAFHWHGETFTPPPAATSLLVSPYCENQAYAIGKHLALQCHIEMTEQMVLDWCRVGADEIQAAAASPGVQQVTDITAALSANVAELQQTAERVYTQWIRGLKA